MYEMPEAVQSDFYQYWKLESSDEKFTTCVTNDIEEYLAECSTKTVLLFPPMNNRRRYMIHKICERYKVSTLSVGEGDRRLVLVSVLPPYVIKRSGTGKEVMDSLKTTIEEGVNIDEQLYPINPESTNKIQTEHLKVSCDNEVTQSDKQSNLVISNVASNKSMVNGTNIIENEVTKGAVSKTRKARPDAPIYMPPAIRKARSTTSTAKRLDSRNSLPISEIDKRKKYQKCDSKLKKTEVKNTMSSVSSAVISGITDNESLQEEFMLKDLHDNNTHEDLIKDSVTQNANYNNLSEHDVASDNLLLPDDISCENATKQECILYNEVCPILNPFNDETFYNRTIMVDNKTDVHDSISCDDAKTIFSGKNICRKEINNENMVSKSECNIEEINSNYLVKIFQSALEKIEILSTPKLKSTISNQNDDSNIVSQDYDMKIDEKEILTNGFILPAEDSNVDCKCTVNMPICLYTSTDLPGSLSEPESNMIKTIDSNSPIEIFPTESQSHEQFNFNEDDVQYKSAIKGSTNGTNRKNTDDSVAYVNLTWNDKNTDIEAQELLRASEEINRSNKRIMKPSFNTSDLLIINESVATEACELDSWEDLFDDSGHLDATLLSEITDQVGQVTITKAKEDYKEFKVQKNVEVNLTHVVEIYGFPSEFQTRDLLTIFESHKNDTYTIKWVDDSHALGIFGSEFIANEVLKIEHPLIKIRPMSEASKQSISKAKRYPNAMMPVVVRPQTCLHAARRMVTGALGLKMKNSKEEREKEKMILKEAREKRRLAAKQQDDAWEGRVS